DAPGPKIRQRRQPLSDGFTAWMFAGHCRTGATGEPSSQAPLLLRLLRSFFFGALSSTVGLAC
ncbi:MAG: hypothetical protein ACK56I_31215, partial [bacterium]